MVLRSSRTAGLLTMISTHTHTVYRCLDVVAIEVVVLPVPVPMPLGSGTDCGTDREGEGAIDFLFLYALYAPFLSLSLSLFCSVSLSEVMYMTCSKHDNSGATWPAIQEIQNRNKLEIKWNGLLKSIEWRKEGKVTHSKGVETWLYRAERGIEWQGRAGKDRQAGLAE